MAEGRSVPVRPPRRVAVAAIGVLALVGIAIVVVLGRPAPGRPAPGPVDAARHPAPTSAGEGPVAGGARGPEPLTGAGQVSRGGTVIRRTIAAPSGFPARTAVLYLPRAVGVARARTLPVVELLHGLPGSPADWTTRGQLRATVDAYADQHSGNAPIVVMPDINGRQHTDTECVHSAAGGDVEQYLARDVPDWVESHYRAADPGAWSVVGISEGGTCSAMLALRHPATFRAFGDLSGLAHLTVGDHDDRARTVAELFGGSQSAYDRHDPPWLLAHRRYPALAAWFECGANDSQVRRDQAALLRAARLAGLSAQATLVSGGHGWPVFSAAFRDLLPWLLQHTPVGS